MAKFRTKARAIDLLGKNQIADLPTAITELWKNGYDAYGDLLRADLFKAGCGDVLSDILVISDDGYGMTQQEILDKWVVLGTDSKVGRTQESLNEHFGKTPRVPLGEKGIGRLSVAYLGNHMLMVSKKENSPMAALFIHWGILQNSELYIDDIDIPICDVDDVLFLQTTYKNLLNKFRNNFNMDKSHINLWKAFEKLQNNILEDLDKYCKIPEKILDLLEEIYFAKNSHGTAFIVFDPIEEIQEIGKPIDTDDETNLRGHQYRISVLSGLFNPFDEAMLQRREKDFEMYDGEDFREYPAFYIHGTDGSRRNYLTSIGEFFTLDDYDNCEHQIDGSFDETGCFNGTIKVFGQNMPYKYQPMKKLSLSRCGCFKLRMAFWESDKKKTSMSKEMFDQYQKKGEVFSGFYIYRDGFRVLPYGKQDNDFLNFEERRTKNAGRHYFSYRKMIGQIAISRKENPNLIDKAGREGMISNVAYRQLKEVLQQFFYKIADDHYGRNSEDRKEYLKKIKERKAQAEIMLSENNRQKTERNALMKKIYAHENDLEALNDEAEEYMKICNQSIFNGYIKIGQEDKFYKKLNKLKEELHFHQIIKQPDIILEDDEENYNDYEEYQKNYKILDDKINQIEEFIVNHTYIDYLQTYYKEQMENVRENIDKYYDEYRERFSATANSLQAELDNIIEDTYNMLRPYLPQNIDIKEMAEQDILHNLSGLKRNYDNWQRDVQSMLESFLRHYESLRIGQEILEILGAYRSVNGRLQRESAEVFELAQMGMAIEQQDHQFNALYGKIHDIILGLNRKQLPENLQQDFQMLKMFIQHLEDNYKKLQPLYHVSKKRRTNITGTEIIKTVRSFYGDILESEQIELDGEPSFLRWSLFSYDSIIMPVVLNIINNAVYWLRKVDNRHILFFLSPNDELVICNSGPKMKPAELDRCFELFYSKKSMGRGIGLYLAKITLRSIGMDIYTTQDKDYNRYQGACFVIMKGVLEE